MLILDFNVLNQEVQKIARKYSRNTTMSYDDMYQELWLWMTIKNPGDLALARSLLVNRAIDLSRNDWKVNGGLCSTDYDNPLGELFVSSNESIDSHKEKDHFEESLAESVIMDALNKLGTRERKYVVAKGYLECNIEFLEDEFMSILNELNDTERDTIMSSPKAGTDDMILKIILHIKTGTNSGSIRSIKTNLRNSFRTVLVDNL